MLRSVTYYSVVGLWPDEAVVKVGIDRRRRNLLLRHENRALVAAAARSSTPSARAPSPSNSFGKGSGSPRYACIARRQAGEALAMPLERFLESLKAQEPRARFKGFTTISADKHQECRRSPRRVGAGVRQRPRRGGARARRSGKERVGSAPCCA